MEPGLRTESTGAQGSTGGIVDMRNRFAAKLDETRQEHEVAVNAAINGNPVKTANEPIDGSFNLGSGHRAEAEEQVHQMKVDTAMIYLLGGGKLPEDMEPFRAEAEEKIRQKTGK